MKQANFSMLIIDSFKKPPTDYELIRFYAFVKKLSLLKVILAQNWTSKFHLSPSYNIKTRYLKLDT